MKPLQGAKATRFVAFAGDFGLRGLHGESDSGLDNIKER
jgi:hypothetical protein